MHNNKFHKEMYNQNLKYGNPLHKNLDKFIQNCLNKFKFIEPEKKLYDICGEDNNSIISHKSTIPDLVIWNKTFNKNECFEDCCISEISPFPRYKFFLRFNRSKDKKKKPDKKRKKNNNKSNKSDEKNSSHRRNLKCNSEINEEKTLVKSSHLKKNNLDSVLNLMEKINVKDNNVEDSNEHYAEDTKDKTDKKESNNSSQDQNEIVDDTSINHKNNSDFIKFINSHHLSEQNNKNIRLVPNSNKKPNNIIFKNNNNYQNINRQSPQRLNNNYIFQNMSSQNKNNNYWSSHFYETKYTNSNLCTNKNSLFSSNKSNKHSLLSSLIKNDKKTMNDYYQNQFKQNELLMNFVYSYLDKKGWMVFDNNRNYICNYTSFELFAFLTNILKNNNDLKYYLVGMPDNSAKFNGEQIYIILSQTLPIILQKKQYDLMQHEKEIEKNIENDKEKDDDENRYNLNVNYNNLEVEDSNDIYALKEEDENYYDFNLNENDFLMNEPQENKYDNFDSSLFGQNHK